MEMRDRLIDILVKHWFDGMTMGECADMLIADGWIRPPCKVGQTVYYIAFGKVYKSKCHAITQHKHGLQIHLYDCDGDNASISAKLVFLTKKEAENALKGMVENGNG